MLIQILQHVPFEGPGSLLDHFHAAGDSVTFTDLYSGEPLPSIEAFDWLVVMGGPMGVNDEAEFPWLVSEKALIREAINSGKIVLGICLGSQLIASALGAAVTKNAHKEIGWFPIRCTSEASTFGFPRELTVFHWHGDTFALPAGAVALASSEGCANQGFAIGNRVLALQFHPEVTPAALAGMAQHCRAELVPGRFVQQESELAVNDGRFEEAFELTGRLVRALRNSISLGT